MTDSDIYAEVAGESKGDADDNDTANEASIEQEHVSSKKPLKAEMPML
jgi:hypothetical protein